MNPVTVWISSPSAVLKAGLSELVRTQPGFAVVDQPDSAQVWLTDLSGTPDAAAPEDPPAIALSEGSPPELIKAGYAAALDRDPTPGELAAALHAASAGMVLMDRTTLMALGAAERTPTLGAAQPLTPREVEVLRLLADGLANKEIAGRLAISDHTVKFHVAAILNKLHAASRAEAVAIGMRAGLILL